MQSSPSFWYSTLSSSGKQILDSHPFYRTAHQKAGTMVQGSGSEHPAGIRRA
jgi:hypothetical protein